MEPQVTGMDSETEQRLWMALYCPSPLVQWSLDLKQHEQQKNKTYLVQLWMNNIFKYSIY